MLDASATLPWCFRDEETEYTRALQEELADGEVLVPAIWPFEIVNALVMAERRGRIAVTDIERFIGDVETMRIAVDGGGASRAFHEVRSLARRHGGSKLTAYDAAYLDLALRESIPLATLDSDLIQAAMAEGVSVFQPGAANGSPTSG